MTASMSLPTQRRFHRYRFAELDSPQEQHRPRPFSLFGSLVLILRFHWTVKNYLSSHAALPVLRKRYRRTRRSLSDHDASLPHCEKALKNRTGRSFSG